MNRVKIVVGCREILEAVLREEKRIERNDYGIKKITEAMIALENYLVGE